MPINPNALSAPEPERPEDLDDAPEVKEQIQAEVPKRTRRKKAEMIADAVVPGMDDVVEIKDAGTGAKIERPWRVAVEMFRDKKATWADKSQEYAFLKYEQERSSSAFSADAAAAHSDTGEDPANPEPDPMPAPSVDNADEPQETHDASGQRKAPEGAELGDEVIIGASVYNVGHGHVLVQGVVAKNGEIIQPKQRWKRELGNPSGPFIAEQIGSAKQLQEAKEARGLEQGASSNGKADGVKVEAERLPREQEELGDGMIKVGTGIIEKIGLPQVEQYAAGSSLQVGPITASRVVFDDGRRDVVQFSDGRAGEVITAVVETLDLLDNTVEFVAARFRGQLVAFLAATGALKQPVS